MRKTIATIEELHEMHRQGQLEQAKKGYRALLATQPQHSEALHALGLIYVEENKLDKAADYLEQAMKADANNPSITLHLANVFKRQGLFLKAGNILKQALAQHPDYAPGYNNLGTVYYSQGKLEEAVKAYEQALAKQDKYTDAHYNLGLTLSKLERFDQALLAFKAVLAQAPEHAAARFQLACLYMQQENWSAAENEFLLLEKAYPEHFETQMNFATTYLSKGALAEARLHYEKALALNPNDAQILFNLGHIHSQQGELVEAIHYYQQLLKLNPDDFSAHNNLGAIYSSQRKTKEALKHFQEALRLDPQNQAIAHIVKILQQDREVVISPPEYLKSLFNFYANHYDNHLLQVLQYRVPQLLLESFLAKAPSRSSKLDILDLGCGTGLCGQLFKPYAKHLVGVDLAAQMLQKAAAKGIYDQLIEADLEPFLKEHPASFDLILAGDVLVYFGDLAPLFKSIKQALKPKGFFLFNLELSEGSGFSLSTSGRFKHQPAYVNNILADEHFEILQQEQVSTRQQDKEALKGLVYLLQSK